MESMAGKHFTVGIIGMGDMGRMYAQRISRAGWRVVACDVPDRFDALKSAYQDSPIEIVRNGHLVARVSDYCIYMVEAESIKKVVAMYGPSTKYGAIVGGQTSCKAPEIEAFEEYLPDDLHIVSCHSMHGPSVDPRGQPLVIVPHRASESTIERVEEILACMESKMVRLSAQEHDKITADTQSVIHAAFLSMGTAWQANGQYPWELSRFSGGIENIKTNVTLRIFSNKWHVYAGLAIFNPAGREQIREYSKSVKELYTLLLERNHDIFEERVRQAGRAVFPYEPDHKLLLRDDVLDQYSLSSIPKELRRPNNHLSLLAMVDCWWRLNIDPYSRMICSTPLYRLWLGVTEYIYRQPDVLNDTISTAVTDSTFRADDLEFTIAAREWSTCVSNSDFETYRKRFESAQAYFQPRIQEANQIGNAMIQTILANT